MSKHCKMRVVVGFFHTGKEEWRRPSDLAVLELGVARNVRRIPWAAQQEQGLSRRASFSLPKMNFGNL